MADQAIVLSAHLDRKRPWFYATRIDMCEEGGRARRTPLRSCPSGHSTVGYALALALAHLRPILPRASWRGERSSRSA
jgi:membrane-associated phospholipid phosphatase